ncbi:hypothetical protein I3J27_36840 [Bradyrhizobium xenonodulans]|uniref:Uncharacterized protein n=1 Tax=Bradyrhizobium xenonodulans TaxID=2736875 RepID=A0ABY7MJ61_9BRAD|nr:hypothetical protein [Bradyrhizobium xenonodulans]WBL78442.1 hypothetical protein I3J27_36840 [Bradyrhizobium xenonodulans]
MSEGQDSSRLPPIQAIDAIRGAPSMYVGEHPTGALLAGRMAETLILLDATPLKVVNAGAWYSVYAEKDWLARENGTPSFDAFYRLVPLQGGGRFCDRAEVLLTALAHAVATVGVDGTNWIRGEPAEGHLPDGITLSLPQNRGRLVVFCYAQPVAAGSKASS